MGPPGGVATDGAAELWMYQNTVSKLGTGQFSQEWVRFAFKDGVLERCSYSFGSAYKSKSWMTDPFCD
jgi:hypothetical protein